MKKRVKRPARPRPEIPKAQAMIFYALTQDGNTTIDELARAAYPHELSITIKALPQPGANKGKVRRVRA